MELINSQLRTIVDSVKAGLLWARGHGALIALISLCVSVPLWLFERDARVRREMELGQLRRQAAAEIATLRARVEAALEDADASAQRVRDLEARRRQLEREEGNLKSEIVNLRNIERARQQEVAALPFPALAERLRRELGPGSFGTRDLPAQAGSGLEKQEFPVASSRLPEKPTEGTGSADNSKLQIQDSRSPNPQPRVPNPESQVPARPAGGPNPELVLTEAGARAVAAALVERDACREQAQVKDGLLANCQEQSAASRAVIEEMNRSVLSLKEAVRLKDEIQARSDAVHRAELKAARGSRLRRFGRALQYVGAGVVIGVVIAH